MILSVLLADLKKGYYFGNRIHIPYFLKTLPMKMIVQLYKHNPIVALIVNSVAFFLWATTLIIIITIMAVAFTG